MFLINKCGLRPEDILMACPMRNRQQFWVSFKTEALANSFEQTLINGVNWGDGNIVHGKRLDVPALHVRVRGAAMDVKKETIVKAMSKYGVRPFSVGFAAALTIILKHSTSL